MPSDMMVIFKVFPEEPGLEKGLAEKIKEKLPSVREIKEDPIAFGLVALRVALVLKDEGSAQDQAEQVLKGLPGVSNVEVEGSTLL